MGLPSCFLIFWPSAVTGKSSGFSGFWEVDITSSSCGQYDSTPSNKAPQNYLCKPLVGFGDLLWLADSTSLPSVPVRFHNEKSRPAGLPLSGSMPARNADGDYTADSRRRGPSGTCPRHVSGRDLSAGPDHGEDAAPEPRAAIVRRIMRCISPARKVSMPDVGARVGIPFEAESLDHGDAVAQRLAEVLAAAGCLRDYGPFQNETPTQTEPAFLVATHGVTRAIGVPRPVYPVDAPWADRARRAHLNAIENLAVFAPLVPVGAIIEVSTQATMLSARIYVVARLIHYFIYVAGIPVIRTLAFLAGACATLAIAVALLRSAM